ncbi:MAG: ABC transporter ATP-binding protein [Beutenbergiaceae bacterium]
MSSTAINLQQVHKSFHPIGAQTVHAVDGVDLSIDRGEIVAFLGPNGAGKTTTVDMILGLTSPTSGTIDVYGTEPRSAVRGGKVGAVLQSGGLLGDLTVRETVDVIASTYPKPQAVASVIEQAGLGDIATRRVSKCSGGEQQRLRFALALLPDPDLLILDEPTAGMDVGARHEFWATMHAQVETGRTVVFATHYLEEANSFAKRIVMIANGRIVADGTTADIRARATGRVVSATVPEHMAARIVSDLEERDDVVSVSMGARRITVRATDSDAVALALLTQGAANLDVTAGSLDDAFLTLTATEKNR